MLLTEIHSALRIDLQDTTEATYTDEELTRAINKVISLMSRVIPKIAIAEFTIKRTISDETLTVNADSIGFTAYKPIKYNTEVITLDGTTYVRDTDYTINYTTGEITGLTEDEYNIDYMLDPYALDISSILDGLINVSRVEYPMNQTPASYPVFNWYGDLLFLLGDDTLTDGQHLRVIYYKTYLIPSESEAGDYPLHLDEAVITGATGQALLSKARAYFDEALATAEDSSETLGNADADLTAADEALDKVTTYLNNAQAYLQDGDSLINAVNAGRDVGATFASYAAQEANIANQYIAEATTRLNAAATELSKVERHTSATANYLAVITAMTEAGQAKLNEFFAMIGVKIELGTTTVEAARG